MGTDAVALEVILKLMRIILLLVSLACVAGVSVGFGSKALQREKWSE